MIISSSNEKIKEIRSLKEKKYRDKSGLYLVVGIKPVNEAAKFNETLKTIVYTAEYKGDLPENTGAELIEVDLAVFKTISDEVTPQGILAVVEKKTAVKPKEISVALLLDRVSDPGNLGAVIRTAVAAGYNDIFLLSTVDPYNPKTVRASMSGIFKARLYDITGKNIEEEIGLPIISADMSGENIFKFKKAEKFCLAIGNEANGLSEEVRRLSKKTVSIPMMNGTESLNAAVSAGILMYLLKYNT